MHIICEIPPETFDYINNVTDPLEIFLAAYLRCLPWVEVCPFCMVLFLVLVLTVITFEYEFSDDFD